MAYEHSSNIKYQLFFLTQFKYKEEFREYIDLALTYIQPFISLFHFECRHATIPHGCYDQSFILKKFENLRSGQVMFQDMSMSVPN